MPIKLWTTGELLTSSDVNNYLMKQSIISCTSGTRPSSPQDGMLIWETDTERYVSWNATLSAWVVKGQTISSSFTPTLTATTNPTLGTGNLRSAKYTLWNGKMCTYWGAIIFGSSGASAGSGQYLVTLPVAAGLNPSVLTTGAAILRDDNGGSGVIQPASSYLSSAATTLSIVTTSGLLGSGTPWTWGALDYLQWNITYETA